MSCEICKRNSCTRSFHSIEEQNIFDETADVVKDRMKDVLKNRIERLKDYANTDDDRFLIDMNEVLSVIDDY